MDWTEKIMTVTDRLVDGARSDVTIDMLVESPWLKGGILRPTSFDMIVWTKTDISAARIRREVHPGGGLEQPPNEPLHP